MSPCETWAEAKEKKTAYFPRTFEQDGCFTHATGVPARLLEVANHFYSDDERPWVCLQMTRTGLRNAGIYVKDEKGAPPWGTYRQAKNAPSGSFHTYMVESHPTLSMKNLVSQKTGGNT